jgi:hypothetical protein
VLIASARLRASDRLLIMLSKQSGSLSQVRYRATFFCLRGDSARAGNALWPDEIPHAKTPEGQCPSGAFKLT